MGKWRNSCATGASLPPRVRNGILPLHDRYPIDRARAYSIVFLLPHSTFLSDGERMNIYAGNLSYQTNEQDLRDAFEAFGAVSSSAVIKDRETGQSKGFGFVEMANNAEADAAIKALNGRAINGRNIMVNQAEPRKERTGGGGGGGGRY